MVVHADDDPFMPSAGARLMANEIESSQLEMLASGEHVLALAQPDDVADLAETFLTGRSLEPVIERELLAVLCIDIVDSTKRATDVGDVEWRRIIGEFDVATHGLVERGRGTVVKFTGDGHLATFDRPGKALRSNREVTDIAEALGIPIRSGIHFGGVEILDGDILGVAVVIATRVMGLGGAGETITTSTVVDLVEGADYEWRSIGSHDLKGINRSRELWSLRQPR